LIVKFYPDYPQLGLVILAYMGSEVIKAFTIPQIIGLRKNLEFGKLAI
jgi:hypothetical protein